MATLKLDLIDVAPLLLQLQGLKGQQDEQPDGDL